jgi:thiol-disulfide isomerase/thioredoxin
MPAKKKARKTVPARKKPKTTPIEEKIRKNAFAILLAIVAIIALGYMANAIMAGGLKPQPKFNISAVAEIQIILLNASDCPDCIRLDRVVEDLKSMNVTVLGEKTVEFGSDEANALIAKYGIDKVPSMVVTGNTNTSIQLIAYWSQVGTVEEDGALVMTKQPPVYVNTSSGKVVGRVSATYLRDSSCVFCSDPALFASDLKKTGMAIVAEKSVEWNSSEGQALITKYGIDKAPILILSQDAGAYPWFSTVLDEVGTKESDGKYVQRFNVMPPYKNLATGEYAGLVKLVYLTDENCSGCYDPALLKPSLQNMGLYIENEYEYDINNGTGKAYVAGYGITAAPTIMLSPDAGLYPLLASGWSKYGTKEPNGWYLLRNVSAVGKVTYKDLKTGEIKTS